MTKRYDTTDYCHCGAQYHGSDHCPACGCEQYETINVRDCEHFCTQEEHGCGWLIQVASGNPEPDFPEDLYRIIECGGKLTVNEHGSWKCEFGHEHVSFMDPARGEYEAEQVFRERQEG
jgi:hypothetical protein